MVIRYAQQPGYMTEKNVFDLFGPKIPKKKKSGNYNFLFLRGTLNPRWPPVCDNPKLTVTKTLFLEPGAKHEE